MGKINVLVVVDALGAGTSGSLKDNVYLVDTEKYLGSWNEGQNDLHTLTEDGQFICWSVVSVNTGSDVDINSFSGQMVDQKICCPSRQGIEGDYVWEGRIESSPGRYPYTVSLSIDGNILSFTAYLEVQ